MPTTWDNLEKPTTYIGGWTYDEAGITYDMVIDLDTGNKVYYDGLGLLSVWTNINKI